jgi:hypothetical protein
MCALYSPHNECALAQLKSSKSGPGRPFDIKIDESEFPICIYQRLIKPPCPTLADGIPPETTAMEPAERLTKIELRINGKI